MYNVQEIVQRIDSVIENLDNPDVEARRKAAAEAQYAFCGNLPSEKGKKLLEKVSEKLRLFINGHAVPAEPDEYVRERCADCFRLAAEGGKDIHPYIPLVRLAYERDPHEWVRERAQEALEICDKTYGVRVDKSDIRAAFVSFSTRPAPVDAKPPVQKPEKRSQPRSLAIE
jgi:hypothetical protein